MAKTSPALRHPDVYASPVNLWITCRTKHRRRLLSLSWGCQRLICCMQLVSSVGGTEEWSNRTGFFFFFFRRGLISERLCQLFNCRWITPLRLETDWKADDESKGSSSSIKKNVIPVDFWQMESAVFANDSCSCRRGGRMTWRCPLFSDWRTSATGL